MTQLFAFIVSIFMTASAFASADYEGSWCQRYSDFTEVLIIDAKDQVASYTMGTTHNGERSPTRKGFVSLGASGFQMVIDKIDSGVVDYKVRKVFLSERRVLILKKSDGEREKFVECSL